MDDFRNAHTGGDSNGLDADNFTQSLVPKNGLSKADGVSAVNRVWGGDKRIALFGYTLETINLLLLPMIKTK